MSLNRNNGEYMKPGSMKPRVCVVGAGPSGMAVLYHFAQHKEAPEIQCFEKQQDWGGLWNYTWQTGTDQYGEVSHPCMYKHLWSNIPKELIEFQDYTFEDHFGKLLPSYAPRSAIRDYLLGRYSKGNIKDQIKFNTPVRNVQYRENTDDFLVTVQAHKSGVTYSTVFSHVIIASGVFIVPSKPEFPGIESFEGLVIHSKDFRDARAFTGQRILCIGASFSAEDIAIQCLKFGAKQIICSWKTEPMNYNFPKNIEERPLVERFENKTAYFIDGTSADIDVLVYCTGYRNSYPFLENSLRLSETIALYPDNLYKGMVWMKGGHNKLFYIGTQNKYFTTPMFEQQAIWIRKYIMHEFEEEPKEKAEMETDIKIWRDRFETVANIYDGIYFKVDYVLDLSNMTGYAMNIGAIREYLSRWVEDRRENIVTYKDQQFASIITGTIAPPLKYPWITVLDDSIEYYLNSGETKN